MIRKIVCTSILISSVGIVNAAETLSGDEIKTLFTNKTFDIHNVAKDKNLQGYDNDEGDHYVYIPWKDKVSERRWWVEDSKHCTSHPKRGDNCKVMKSMGDGVYHGYSNGEHTHTLSNFRQGKDFNK